MVKIWLYLIYLNVKKRYYQSSCQEGARNRRLIEGPNVESPAEENQESQQKTHRNSRAFIEEGPQAIARIENKQEASNFTIERQIYWDDRYLQRYCCWQRKID